MKTLLESLGKHGQELSHLSTSHRVQFPHRHHWTPWCQLWRAEEFQTWGIPPRNSRWALFGFVDIV